MLRRRSSAGSLSRYLPNVGKDTDEPLYERFCGALEALGVPVARGVFGARMEVEFVNDGPVTIVLDG